MAIGTRRHKLLTGDNVGSIVRWTVADATARLALLLTADDIGAIAWQQDDNSYHILANYTTPTWVQLGNVTTATSSASAPTINDDELDGYEVGSTWVETTTPAYYVLVDKTAGAAVWLQVAGGGGASNDTQLSLTSVIGTPTIDKLNELIDATLGVTKKNGGGTITDDGDGTVTVSAGQGYIRATNSDTAQLYGFDWSSTPLTPTDNSLNFIYVEYNAGSPQVVITTTKRTDLNTNLYLGSVYRTGTFLHITNHAYPMGNVAARLVKRFNDTDGLRWSQGATMTETGTRNVAVTSSTWWHGLDESAIASFDTSVASTFTYFYRDGVGGWNVQTTQTQINNTQYDDGSGTLATLSASRYGVHWVYVGVDDHLYVIFGRGDYTASQWEGEAAPSPLPPHMQEQHAGLIGRIAIQNGSATFHDITSAFDVGVGLGGGGGGVTDHGALTGLLDDDHTQYILDGGSIVANSIPIGNAARTLQGHSSLTYTIANGDFHIASGGANLRLNETTIAIKTAAAGEGIYYVKNTAPTRPHFISDTNVDHPVVIGPTAGATDNALVRWDGSLGTVQDSPDFLANDIGNLVLASTNDPALAIRENAGLASVAAGYGYYWTKNTAPTSAWFTNDLSEEVLLTHGSMAGPSYKFSSSISATDPTSGYFRLNSGSYDTATALYINSLDRTGQGIHAILVECLGTDSQILVVDEKNPDNRWRFWVTGWTDNGGWLTVNLDSAKDSKSTSAGAIPTNDATYGIQIYTPTSPKGLGTWFHTGVTPTAAGEFQPNTSVTASVTTLKFYQDSEEGGRFRVAFSEVQQGDHIVLTDRSDFSNNATFRVTDIPTIEDAATTVLFDVTPTNYFITDLSAPDEVIVNIIPGSVRGGILFAERTDHAHTPTAGYGEIWVDSVVTDTYSNLKFTDGNTGTDSSLVRTLETNVGNRQLATWGTNGNLQNNAIEALGTTLQGLGGLEFEERAAVEQAVGAGQGTFWVRNDTPSTPMFTGDTSVAVRLGKERDVALAINESVSIDGTEVVIGGAYLNPAVAGTLTWEMVATYNDGGGGGNQDLYVYLYERGPDGTPTAGTLRSTLLLDTSVAGLDTLDYVSQTLTVSASPGTDADQLQNAARFYEVRAKIDATGGVDSAYIHSVRLIES